MEYFPMVKLVPLCIFTNPLGQGGVRGQGESGSESIRWTRHTQEHDVAAGGYNLKQTQPNSIFSNLFFGRETSESQLTSQPTANGFSSSRH